VLLRPSDVALAKVTALWNSANPDAQVPLQVVLVQLRQGGHTHSYKLLNESGEATLLSCALAMPQDLDVPCHQLAYFIAADKQKGRGRAAEWLSRQNCSRVLHSHGPIVRSGDDLNREKDEGGYSPVQIDDEGRPRTVEGKCVLVLYCKSVLRLHSMREAVSTRHRLSMGRLVGRRVRISIPHFWTSWFFFFFVLLYCRNFVVHQRCSCRYAQHAVLTDRSSYAFSARLFAIGSSMLLPSNRSLDVPVTVRWYPLARMLLDRMHVTATSIFIAPLDSHARHIPHVAKEFAGVER
jgi:hypothetical protein